MKKTLLAMVVAISTVLLFANTVYADAESGDPSASANLQAMGRSNNMVFLQIGDAELVDLLTWTLGVPTSTYVADDAATSVYIEVNVNMTDATEDCILRVRGYNLVSGGNVIPISRFNIAATGDFSFNVNPVAFPLDIETLTTSGRYIGTFQVTYDHSYYNAPGTYVGDRGTNALSFIAYIQ